MLLLSYSATVCKRKTEDCGAFNKNCSALVMTFETCTVLQPVHRLTRTDYVHTDESAHRSRYFWF